MRWLSFILLDFTLIRDHLLILMMSVRREMNKFRKCAIIADLGVMKKSYQILIN